MLKRIGVGLGAAVMAAAVLAAPADSGQVVLRAEWACALSINGKAVAQLDVGATHVAELPAGEALVDCVGRDVEGERLTMVVEIERGRSVVRFLRAPSAPTASGSWAEALSRHIAKRWLRPPGLPSETLSATVRVEIHPNGEVVDATIVRKSGHDEFDTSATNAVFKASPLPLPSDPKAFTRVLQMTMTPAGLMQSGS